MYIFGNILSALFQEKSSFLKTQCCVIFFNFFLSFSECLGKLEFKIGYKGERSVM